MPEGLDTYLVITLGALYLFSRCHRSCNSPHCFVRTNILLLQCDKRCNAIPVLSISPSEFIGNYNIPFPLPVERTSRIQSLTRVNQKCSKKRHSEIPGKCRKSWREKLRSCKQIECHGAPERPQTRNMNYLPRQAASTANPQGMQAASMINRQSSRQHRANARAYWLAAKRALQSPIHRQCERGQCGNPA